MQITSKIIIIICSFLWIKNLNLFVCVCVCRWVDKIFVLRGPLKDDRDLLL